MGLGKWLENWSMRDLDKWARDNPTYDPERHSRPDSEYLFYINSKLQHANTVLLRIERLLGFVLAVAVLAFLKYAGLF